MEIIIAPLLMLDLRKNSTADMLCAALVFLTNHEIMLGDIPPIYELSELRDILEELRRRDSFLRCETAGGLQ